MRGGMRFIVVGFSLFFCGLLTAEETECIEYASVRRIKNTKYFERCEIDIKSFSLVCRNDKNRWYSVTEFDNLSDLARSYREKITLNRRLSVYMNGVLLWSNENIFDAQKRVFKVIQKVPPGERVYEFTTWDARGRPLRGMNEKDTRCPQEVIYHYDDKSGEISLLERQNNPQCPPHRLLMTQGLSGNDPAFVKLEVNGEMIAFDKFEVIARDKACFPKP